MSSLKPCSPVGERRIDVCSDRNDLFRELSDQVDEKSHGVFRCSRRDLRINVFRDLFDGEKDLEGPGR